MPNNYQQSWPMPTQPVPIVIFGAGSIVSDAHLPAYEQNNLPVIGLYDPDYEKAKALGQKFNISVFKDPAEAAAIQNCIFDLVPLVPEE